MAENGIFITLEGGEGCGKTTQLPLLAAALRTRFPGREIIETRSPGGTPTAEKIRSVLKEPVPSDDLLPETELLLFAACHAQMCERLVRPALSRGAILIADRFCDSTVVYQGVARGLDPDWIAKVNAFACKGTEPALTILLDLDPESAVARTRLRSSGPGNDRFDSETISFHRAVRRGFLKRAAEYPARFAVVDAAADVNAVHSAILEVIRERLALF